MSAMWGTDSPWQKVDPPATAKDFTGDDLGMCPGKGDEASSLKM